MKKILITLFLIPLIFLLGKNALAQAPMKLTSGDIYEKIQKAQILGTVLYIAAHPDDENTRMISYLSNELKVNTAYLSLTRGDGGQNLIGPEIRELLGVIRTEELLAARRVDGGKQMFTRANDFGYSKNPKETLEIWEQDEVLADVIWSIRKFQPDVIINRFSHDSGRRTHGHHTSSAVLSFKAFDLVGDKKQFSEQLKYVDAWQPRRLFMNTSWWFYGSRDKFAKADKTKMLSVDAGVYYPVKGKSNNEIAAESRSMHKCQGMGSTPSRGSQMEYLNLLKGDMPKNKEDIFDGINITWTRIDGGKAIGKLLGEVDNEFNYGNPSASLPKLMKAYQLIKKLPDGYWKKIKQQEIEDIIVSCMGLFAEAKAEDYSATPGEEVELNMEVVNRSNAQAELISVEYLPTNLDSTLNLNLVGNQTFKFSKKLNLPNDMPLTGPYWLRKKASLGMYAVENQELRGLPNTPRTFKVRFNLKIEGVKVSLEREIIYKKTDPVKGEVYRPFEVTIPIFANLTEKVFVFSDDKSKDVKVLLKSGKKDVSGTLELCHPEGWKVEPELVDFDLKMKGEEQTFTFKLFPPKNQDVNFVTPLVKIGNQSYTQELVSIEYDHIPTQTVLKDGEAKVVKIDLKKEGENIAYIMGAGDEIPTNLEQIGYNVTLLEDKDISVANLKNYDALIIGIRAYNTVERLKFHQDKLFQYVEEGGTMIVQYNTGHRLKLPKEKVAPYPLNISRDRVALETAEVRILKPDHHVMNYPNKITTKDFDGWVQERGLYFPNEWDGKFEAILSSNDPDEPARDGGLLIAQHGKGYYVYTGYSWFRELPAGVPGAYRIFANLISLGKRP